MSNLNVNNVDVQRMISVLNELNEKMQICSCLTMLTMDKVLGNEKYLEENYGKHVLKILKNHHNNMMKFRTANLMYLEERKEEKNDDESGDEEEGPKTVNKEKQNLKEIEDDIYESHPLVKSTKNVYRELKGNFKLIEYMKSLRADKEIVDFSDDIWGIIQANIKKSKMTLEEEQSERDLNLTLNKKIDDMEQQIKEKKNKLNKLIEDKTNFKNNCTANLEEIKNEIENLKKSTVDDMGNLENNINNRLEEENKYHLEILDKHKDKHNKKMEEFSSLKQEKAIEEKESSGFLVADEDKVIKKIQELDDINREFKRKTEDNSKDVHNLNEEIKKANILLNKGNEQFSLYSKYQKEYDKKVDDNDQERLMEEYACSWIQRDFRGFLSRKQLKKKYGKIVKGLKKPVPDMTVDKDPKAKKKKP
jgi:hypothetical protein